MRIPKLGLGTWRMGEDARLRQAEVNALHEGLDLGVNLIDTAEMYGGGAAEEIVGEAIRGRRDDVFVVSKVLPQNASRDGTIRAAEDSLRRLGTSYIDLYLLHWESPHPLEGTLEAFEQLVHEGKVRHFGLSNFDRRAMEAADAKPAGAGIAADQVLYNLKRRGIEAGLLPWCAERGICVMAYTPLEQGDLTHHDALAEVARRHETTSPQVALAWAMHHEHVVAIPKASNRRHVRENAAALDLWLSDDDLAVLDRAFPPPRSETPLEIL
ncbi:MAG: aldo/keto reductase [Acidobacteria bacterium]|nr:aldo/keto reductase [Acidobacteriota bacterium]